MAIMLNMSLKNQSTCNSSSCNDTDRPEIYNSLGSAVPIFLTVYTLILMFAVAGNALVCYIVASNRKMHEVTNYLLVNLSVSDLIQALATVFQITDFVVKDLNLGNVGCKFQINMVNIPYSSSVLTLTVIAIERYCAVCKPLTFHDFKARIKYIIPSIWLASVIIYFPTLYYCGVRWNTDEDQLSCDCTYRWPSLRAKNIYGVFIVIALYLVPLIVISGFYFKVIQRLRVAPPGESESSMAAHRSRRGVVKMLLVTIVVFFLSWTPYNILYFLKRIEYDYRNVYKYVWYPALLLAFLSCACNPVIYCLLSKNFREGFKSVLCCSGSCHLPRITASGGYSSTSKTPTSRSMENIVLENMNCTGEVLEKS